MSDIINGVENSVDLQPTTVASLTDPVQSDTGEKQENPTEKSDGAVQLMAENIVSEVMNNIGEMTSQWNVLKDPEVSQSDSEGDTGVVSNTDGMQGTADGLVSPDPLSLDRNEPPSSPPRSPPSSLPDNGELSHSTSAELIEPSSTSSQASEWELIDENSSSNLHDASPLSDNHVVSGGLEEQVGDGCQVSDLPVDDVHSLATSLVNDALERAINHSDALLREDKEQNEAEFCSGAAQDLQNPSSDDFRAEVGEGTKEVPASVDKIQDIVDINNGKTDGHEVSVSNLPKNEAEDQTNAKLAISAVSDDIATDEYRSTVAVNQASTCDADQATGYSQPETVGSAQEIQDETPFVMEHPKSRDGIIPDESKPQLADDDALEQPTDKDMAGTCEEEVVTPTEVPHKVCDLHTQPGARVEDEDDVATPVVEKDTSDIPMSTEELTRTDGRQDDRIPDEAISTNVGTGASDGSQSVDVVGPAQDEVVSTSLTEEPLREPLAFDIYSTTVPRRSSPEEPGADEPRSDLGQTAEDDNPALSIRPRRYVEEEIATQATVTVHPTKVAAPSTNFNVQPDVAVKPPVPKQQNVADLINDTNWVTLAYFIALSLVGALTCVITEGTLSPIWPLLAMSLASILMFQTLHV